MHELLKYDFDFEFDIPATYPVTAPEICIPELDGKTAKMYRGRCMRLNCHGYAAAFCLCIRVIWRILCPSIYSFSIHCAGGKICLTVHFKPLWAKNR